MSGVRRWRFQAGTEDWTVPQNPAQMTSLFPVRAVQAKATTAGRVLFWEGPTPPAQWSFTGSCRSLEHYEELRRWVYDIKQRVIITDHYGRRIECVLLAFGPVPKRSVGVPWRHDYEVSALVVSVGPPVGPPSPVAP